MRKDPLICTDAERRRAAGRLAGLLCFAAALLFLPSSFLIEPEPPLEAYLVTLLGVVTGAVFYFLPWQRLPPATLHLPPLLGAPEIALVVLVFGQEGQVYAGMYLFIAVWVPFAFASRRVIAAHLSWALALGVSALLVADGASHSALLVVAAGVPYVVVVSIFVVLARERADARESAFRELAERDPLTGVGNYRALQDRLAYEVIRHGRHARPLTLILIDLDNFKSVNDELGHAAGDQLLRAVGRELVTAVRGEDTVARQGGDEFSVIAPEVDPEGAGHIAARIRAALARIDAAGEPLGATLGLASFPSDGTSPEELLARADAALREQKRERRGLAAA